jgi:hypothetical protein
MLMKRDEGGENRPSREELEGMSFDDLTAGLADGTITRSRAIKLAGAALLGGALTVLWPGEADAANRRRRRRKKRRRRRRKAQVTPPLTPVVPGVPAVFHITLPAGEDRTLTIEGFRVFNSEGQLVTAQDLTDPVVIQPGLLGGDVAITFPNGVADGNTVTLIDGRGVPITVVDENGVSVGDVVLDVA